MVAALRRRGILVRYFATPLLFDAIRITIGKPAAMKALLKELKPLVAKMTARTWQRSRLRWSQTSAARW